MRLRALASILAVAALVAAGVTFSGAAFTAASANPPSEPTTEVPAVPPAVQTTVVPMVPEGVPGGPNVPWQVNPPNLPMFQKGTVDPATKLLVTGETKGGFAEVVWKKQAFWVTADYLSKKKEKPEPEEAGMSDQPCPDGSEIESAIQPAAYMPMPKLKGRTAHR